MHFVCVRAVAICILQRAAGCAVVVSAFLQKTERFSAVQGVIAGLFLHCSGVGTVQGHAQFV